MHRLVQSSRVTMQPTGPPLQIRRPVSAARARPSPTPKQPLSGTHSSPIYESSCQWHWWRSEPLRCNFADASSCLIRTLRSTDGVPTTSPQTTATTVMAALWRVREASDAIRRRFATCKIEIEHETDVRMKRMRVLTLRERCTALKRYPCRNYTDRNNLRVDFIWERNEKRNSPYSSWSQHERDVAAPTMLRYIQGWCDLCKSDV